MWSKILIGIASVCFLMAVLVKLTNIDHVLPTQLLPLNWLRLADTFFMFSIALSLLKAHKK